MNWWTENDRRRAGGMRRWHVLVLPVCAAVSIAVHALLLGAPLMRETHPPRSDVLRMHVSSGTPLQRQQQSPAASRSDSIEVSAPAPAAVEQAGEKGAKSFAEGSHPGAASPLAAAPPPPEKHRAEPPKGFEEFLPRAHLTIAPAPLTEIVLAPPPGDDVKVRRIGVLILYIDESGTVQEAVAEEPLLPENFEQAARTAFMSAQFSPGEFAGRPVKSSLRVEVIFEGNAP